MKIAVDQLEWQLDAWLSPEFIAGMLPVMKVAFWLLTIMFVIKIFKRSSSTPKRRSIGKAYRIFFAVIAVLFAAILVYQASWQLTGFLRPDFVEFMKRYNRRPDSPTTRMVRGRILDARGNVLAEQNPDITGERMYPGGSAFCHVIGYENSRYGMTGVEAAEQAVLSGTAVENNKNWETLGRNLFVRDDMRGNDVALTLLAPLQFEAHRQMNGRKGAVVFIDPSNGAILVLYSSPGFDPENINGSLFKGNKRAAPMLNRALQGRYPPGSTMKMLVAAEALEQGISPELYCSADGYRAGSGNKPIRDHEYYEYQRDGKVWKGHGKLTMREALAKSSNVYFAQLGVQLGGETIHAAVVRCGLTRSWTVMKGSSGDIASMAGRFPPLKNRQVAKTAQVSIGQGDMLVTPLHMALLAGAIGRSGSLWAPHLLTTTPPKPVDAVLNSNTASTLAGMMRDAVRNGTGRQADIPGLQVAGKTGTAQNPHGDDHGWFVGFAPATDPVVAFAVIVENGGYGSRSALPIAAAILEKAQQIGVFAGNKSGGRQ